METEIRNDPRVQRLLNNPNWEGAANAAIAFFVHGVPCPITSWTKSSTWTQVKMVCDEYQRTRKLSSHNEVDEKRTTPNIEARLRRDPRVQRLINNTLWEGAANAAIAFFVHGERCSITSWTRSSTWAQVKMVYDEMRNNSRDYA